MNGTKICQQQIWGFRNYPVTSYFVPTVLFNSSDIHRPVSTQDFQFNEQSSNFEFVRRPVE